jgi:Phospholipase_D-nuclease N-terminal
MDLWELMVSILWFMLLVAWFSLLFSILGDLFRSDDLSGWSKAGWCVFVVVIPWLGVLTYLIVRGRSMHERAYARAGEYGNAYYGGQGPAYGAQGNGGGVAGEISRLADMRDQGLLTPQEFDSAKAQVLGTSTPPPAQKEPAVAGNLPA